MNFKSYPAPYLRIKDSARNYMADVLFALCAVMVMSWYYYGTRVIYLALFSVFCFVAVELIVDLMMKRPSSAFDLSAVVSALIYVMLLPAGAPFWMIPPAAVMAMGIAKGCFGGFGNNPFNPAVTAAAFTAITWPAQFFSYVRPVSLGSLDPIHLITGPSAASQLKVFATPQYSMTNLALGNAPAPIGTVSVLVLAACGLFLLARGTIVWLAPASFLATCALYALLFPRNPGMSVWSVVYELTAGSILFASVFIVTDPSTTPNSHLGRVLFGVLTGLGTMLFRRFGAYEEGLYFAVIFANALSQPIDRLALVIREKIRI